MATPKKAPAKKAAPKKAPVKKAPEPSIEETENENTPEATGEPTRTDLVAVVEEINEVIQPDPPFVIDGESVTVEGAELDDATLIEKIKECGTLLEPTDVKPNNPEDPHFSAEVLATMVALGVEKAIELTAPKKAAKAPTAKKTAAKKAAPKTPKAAPAAKATPKPAKPKTEGSKPRGVGVFIKDGITSGKFKDKSNQEIADLVRAEFPGAVTTAAHVGTYKYRIGKGQM